jgi:hypothetical protein
MERHARPPEGMPSNVTMPQRRERWTASLQGALLVVRKHVSYRVVVPENGRGRVVGFSDASRLRCLKEIARINWRGGGRWSLITLTYPDEQADRDYRERTKDRYLFQRYMEKHLGKKVGMLWRTEFAKRLSGKHRGKLVCHHHMVIPYMPFVPHQLVRQWWRNIVHKKGSLSTDIREVAGEQAAFYAMKYAAKRERLSSLDYAAYLNRLVGRPWGLTRKSLLPYCPREDAGTIDGDLLRDLQLLAENTFIGYRADDAQSFTIFGDLARRAGRFIMQKKAGRRKGERLVW